MRDGRGWRFWLDDGQRDAQLGIEYLTEAYLRTDPTYEGRVTVPCIIATATGLVVTNDYPQITLDLSTQWSALHAADAPDLYPEALRAQMDPLTEDIYQDVNNGVYRSGFATTQESYATAYGRLFARLDLLEQRLVDRRFLMGEAISEVDVRLFTTLVRFDAVYHGHFKTNRHRASGPRPVGLDPLTSAPSPHGAGFGALFLHLVAKVRELGALSGVCRTPGRPAFRGAG